MKRRYQVGDDRFDDIRQAAALAALQYIVEPGPPNFVIDRATKRLCALPEFMEAIKLAGEKLAVAGTVTTHTFIGDDGELHLGIKA